jgi:hypothetical protein
MVWIDHVTTSLIGRQHIVLGNNASNRVTISNCKIDGTTSWSATCDGHHYWGLYFTGSNDVSLVAPSTVHLLTFHSSLPLRTTISTVRLDAPRRLLAILCYTLSITTGTTTRITPSK